MAWIYTKCVLPSLLYPGNIFHSLHVDEKQRMPHDGRDQIDDEHRIIEGDGAVTLLKSQRKGNLGVNIVPPNQNREKFQHETLTSHAGIG